MTPSDYNKPHRQKCVIVVPVYKSGMSQTDRTSFTALCRVLGGRWQIAIATHNRVDLSLYQAVATEYHVRLRIETFNPKYFDGIHGYNKLMISPSFYSRFTDAVYILIYQLDAYVFRDELERWCDAHWDYVGAPLFGLRHVTDTAQDAVVGNGGCSLRRTDTMLRALRGEGWRTLRWVFSYHIPQHPYVVFRRRVLYRIMLLFMGVGLRAVPNFLTRFVAEDLFFSFALRGTPFELRVPPVTTAWQFAYNMVPSYWHAQNGGCLPFCCHAWPAQYDFWQRFIPQEK